MDETDLMSKAKAETYAKLIANTIIFRGTDPSAMGRNSFFYESAEGLLTERTFCRNEGEQESDEDQTEAVL